MLVGESGLVGLQEKYKNIGWHCVPMEVVDNNYSGINVLASLTFLPPFSNAQLFGCRPQEDGWVESARIEFY